MGAATLLLLIVKHGPVQDPSESLDLLAPRVEDVQAELQSLETHRDNLRQELAVSEEEIERQIAAMSASSQLEEDRIAAIAKLRDQLSEARKNLSSSQARLQEAQERRELASISAEKPETGNKGNVVGLSVEPSKVLILLDRSASMLDASLVEIIRLRASANALKNNAPKWRTARKSAEWAYQQVENGQTYQILTYSDVVQDLQGNSYTGRDSVEWLTKDETQDQQTVLPVLRGLLPGGATDLHTAFEVAGNLRPIPTQVLLITDGYPTLPGTRSLSRLRDCPRTTAGTTPFLSPSCRMSVFFDASRVLSRKLKGSRVDTVLLRLDGDVNAMHGYWTLSATTGGRLLSPGPNWPTI